MTAIAVCCEPLRVSGSLKLGIWALETSDRRGQDKANWRSQTRRPSAVEKPLSAHWFLEARRLALKRRLSQAGWRLSDFSEQSQRTKRWRSRTSF